MQTTRFQIRVLSHAEHKPRGEDQVSFTLLAGHDWEHLTLCGTLTMTESEFADFVAALEAGMGEPARIEDHTVIA